MTQLVTQQQAALTVEQLLTSPSTLSRLREVLQKSISVERFARVTLNVIRRNPKLLQCRQESLFGSILTLARWGLEPGSDSLAEAYLIPYKDECQPQASYRGLVKMVRRATGNIPVYAEVVKEGDRFDYQLGDEPSIRHTPSDDPERDDKKTTHAYAVARLSPDEKQTVVMSRAAMDRIKQRSPAVKFQKLDSPWFTDTDEMYKKTVTRRLTKGLPMRMEEASAVEEDTELEIAGGNGMKMLDMPAAPEKSRLAKLAARRKDEDAQPIPVGGEAQPEEEPKADPPQPARVPKAKPASGESSPEPAGSAPATATSEAASATTTPASSSPQASPSPPDKSSSPATPDTPSSKDSTSTEPIGKFTGRVQALEYKKVASHTKGLWKYILKFMAEDGEFLAYTLSKDTVKLFEEAVTGDKVCVIDAEPLQNGEGVIEWRLTGFNLE